MARVEKPSALKVILEEKAQVKVLVERVVQLVRLRTACEYVLEEPPVWPTGQEALTHGHKCSEV